MKDLALCVPYTPPCVGKNSASAFSSPNANLQFCVSRAAPRTPTPMTSVRYTCCIFHPTLRYSTAPTTATHAVRLVHCLTANPR